jgi:NAD(P)-dependent dehydrogenase (short-subunit alcohol dehydrogenase family)
MTMATQRHAAIIGGSSGIGLATARLLAEQGWRVTVGGRNEERLAACRDSTGAVTIQVDATDSDSLRHFYTEAGPIDALVVTVTRRGGAGPAESLSANALLDAFAGKTAAHLEAVAFALPTLAEDGSITLVTAGSAQSALPGTAGLAAVNGALEAAVPVLARELAPRRVNAVSPGVIETEWWDGLPEDQRRAMFAEYAQQAPVGRNGTADDVARAIAGMTGNGFITGVVLPVDGGLRLT